jgi:hypothetical protein
MPSGMQQWRPEAAQPRGTSGPSQLRLTWSAPRYAPADSHVTHDAEVINRCLVAIEQQLAELCRHRIFPVAARTCGTGTRASRDRPRSRLKTLDIDNCSTADVAITARCIAAAEQRLTELHRQAFKRCSSAREMARRVLFNLWQPPLED